MSQRPHPPTADTDRISFQLERLESTLDGQLAVEGRWFGIRGRRFMRPTLTVTLADGSQRHSLAELEHKPWAAEDGEPWIAWFRPEVDPANAAATELSVAPDIVVALSTGTGLAGAEAGAPRAPAAPKAAARRRASRPTQQRVVRLQETLAASDRALEAERTRRAASERALEDERAESLRLRAEVGRLQAELDLARAAQAEAAAAAADLESARREILAGERRHDRLTREHDRTVDAHAEARTALHERAGALESAREALDRERAEKDRLRARLAQTQEPRESGQGVPENPDPEQGGASAADPGGPASPTRVQSPGRARASSAATPSVPPVPSRGERPLNPSLRHRTNWLGRTVALLVILAVIAAVLLVIHSTV